MKDRRKEEGKEGGEVLKLPSFEKLYFKERIRTGDCDM